jgi:hypothetical protein
MMQEVFQVFCSQAFFQQLEDDKKSLSDLPENEQDKKAGDIWKKLIEFLDYPKTSVTITAAQPASLMNSVLFHYINRSGTKKIRIVKNENEIEVSQQTHPYCFYFGLSKDRKTIESAGFPKIESWKDDWQVFYAPHAIQISKSEEGEFIWDNMKRYLAQPLHSLVIIDNYLLANYAAMLNNLFRVLSAMLSGRKLTREIHIAIFTNQLYLDRNKNTETLDNIHRKISNYIRHDLSIKSFNLCLVKITSQENHDRHIFTNCYVFRSGNSFSYFDKNGQVFLNSTTDFDIYPQSAMRNQEIFSADYYHRELKKFANILHNPDYQAHGERINRLLDAYLE